MWVHARQNEDFLTGALDRSISKTRATGQQTAGGCFVSLEGFQVNNPPSSANLNYLLRKRFTSRYPGFV